VYVTEHLVVIELQHSDSDGFEIVTSPLTTGGQTPAGAATAVDFDRQLLLGAEEIDYVRSDGMVTDKAMTAKLLAAELPPESFAGHGAFSFLFAQCSGHSCC
jgi:hypothetical protein